MPIFELPGASESTTSAAVTAGKVDHKASALDRLPQQFRGKTNIERLLKVLVAPAQTLEDTFWTLAFERTLTKAVELGLDAVIDRIGKIVGEARGGKTNADYARFINARITARRSHGLIETLIRVSRLVINTTSGKVAMRNQPPAAVIVGIHDVSTTDAVATILLGFLKTAASAGVRVILEWSSDAPSAWFTWDEDVAGKRWDEGMFVDADD